MKNKIARIYNIADSDLIEFCRTAIGNLTNNLQDFTNVDTTVNPAFADDLTQLVEQAEGIQSDEVVTDEQTELTNQVNEKMHECREHYKLIMYFAKKAFPDNAAIRNGFGENNYGKIRASQSKMPAFMKNLHDKATKYQPELLAVGASQEQIDKILTLHDQIVQTNYDQEIFISNRPGLTSVRVEKMNEIWKRLAQISELSQIIYADNFVKMQLFLLPQRKASNTDKSVTVEANQTIVALEEDAGENTFIKIENTGETDLHFYVASQELIELPENTLILNSGKEEIVKSDDICNKTYGKLICVNKTQEQGKFNATLLQ